MGVIRGAFAALNIQGIVGIVVSAALAIFLGLQVHKTHTVENKLNTVTVQLSAAQGTIMNYQQAAEKARAEDLANKQKKEAAEAVLRERTKSDYEARIASARADADRLRNSLRGANQGRVGTPAVSGNQGSGPGAVEAPGDYGLSIDERLTATEQAIQLDELITYVEGIVEVHKE